MSRIDNIKAYAQERVQTEKAREEERQFKCEELTEKIRVLKPRIKELIEVGNACLVNGIEIDKYGKRFYSDYDSYEKGTFVTNGISHRLGFVIQRGQAIFEIGFNAGGACGQWDFRTDGNKVYDVHEKTKEHREASLEHMQTFINKFDEFEMAFYRYVDGITSKQ